MITTPGRNGRVSFCEAPAPAYEPTAISPCARIATRVYVCPLWFPPEVTVTVELDATTSPPEPGRPAVAGDISVPSVIELPHR
ncbi:hypothetical protein D3C78_1810670 [compost metagenome]